MVGGGLRNPKIAKYGFSLRVDIECFMASHRMSNLKSTIESLANEFAMSIISALRAASIDELTGVSGAGAGVSVGARAARVRAPAAEPTTVGRKRGRGGRLGRRSSEDIGRMVDNIVTLLQKSPEGLRAEQIREALDCQAKELPRPLADALAEGRISKSGQKRATTYFAGAKAGEGATAKRRGRGGRRKRA